MVWKVSFSRVTFFFCIPSAVDLQNCILYKRKMERGDYSNRCVSPSCDIYRTDRHSGHKTSRSKFPQIYVNMMITHLSFHISLERRKRETGICDMSRIGRSRCFRVKLTLLLVFKSLRNSHFLQMAAQTLFFRQNLRCPPYAYDVINV